MRTVAPDQRSTTRSSSLPMFMRIESIQRLLDLGRRSKPLWWYPAWSLAAGLLLGIVLTRLSDVDVGPLSFLVYEGDPESARSFVSLAATSVATITSLTLTITVVTLQLASTQYSPRLIEHYLADRGIRAVISLFLLTFAFSVATLLNVRLAGDEADAAGQVPGIAVSLLVVLTIGCLGGLVFFVFEVTRSIRVESILERVRDRTIEAIGNRQQHDPDGDDDGEIPDPDPDGLLIRARRTGFFVDIDRELVERCDVRGAVTVWVLVSTGDFVVRDGPVAVVSGWDGDEDDIRDQVASWLRFDSERWIEADYSYGVRSLADVAIKALSPGINDPTTAVMVIDRIGEVMAVAATSHPERELAIGSDGRLFVTIKSWGWNLRQVLHQLATYGREDVHVVIAMTEMLWSLLWIDSDVDRRAEIAAATEVFRSLVDIDRPEPDRILLDRHLDVLSTSLGRDEPVRVFRQDPPAAPRDGRSTDPG